MQGIKRKRRCQNQCDQHLFSLKNLKNNSKYDIKLTFCPKYQRQPLPPQHTFAEYNNDGLFYTSAFVLGVDKKTIAKNLQKEMLDHQKLIKQNCEKYNQIVFPRPNSKHTTCSVCKETYKNYYIHIFSDEHSEKIQNSPYNVFVKQLCELFLPLWNGCAQKADEQAQNSSDRDRANTQKKGSDQLNLDDILQQEDIDSNPSRISKYLENEEQQEETVKQVVMKRPVRVYEPPQPQRIQKVYQDRESRKKSINFAAFFDDEPKKKIINDHRQALSVSSKKTHKTPSVTDIKSKQKLPLKKSLTSYDDDPFIIEYNARLKRKEKKSYYYIKKKQRMQKQKREREMNLKQQNFDDFEQEEKNSQESQQQNENFKLEQIQNNISKSQQEQYQKYLDQFHQDEKKNKTKVDQLKKPASFDLKLFQEVEKKHYSNPLFQTLSKSTTLEKNPSLNLNPTPNQNKIVHPEINLISSKTYPNKKVHQNGNLYQLPLQKKQILDNDQKQQIIDKNKINHTTQNQLPLFHKFKNPADKDFMKEAEPKLHRPTLQVFNQYEQKIRQYQKQKDYNTKNKISQKINPFQEKVNTQISSFYDESTVKLGRPFVSKGLQETYQYDPEKTLKGQTGQLKIQAFNTKYNNFPETYYKKPSNEKDTQNSISLNPMIPNGAYPSPHQFYPPYGYPMSPYAYPLHEPQKADRPTLKYGQGRENESYERGYYYNAWQHPYYMPPPPGGILSTQSGEIESGPKGYGSFPYNSSKSPESKQVMYPPYPPYPGYPPSNYPPGYYHPSGTPFPASQRGQYPHGQNMRIPPQPNTSININFPMYLPPYHAPYQYQSNPQRYPGQQPSTTSQTQYNTPGQSQMKPQSSQYGNYTPNGLSNLPPYAEYQEYKKRQNDRRR